LIIRSERYLSSRVALVRAIFLKYKKTSPMTKVLSSLTKKPHGRKKKKNLKRFSFYSTKKSLKKHTSKRVVLNIKEKVPPVGDSLMLLESSYFTIK